MSAVYNELCLGLCFNKVFTNKWRTKVLGPISYITTKNLLDSHVVFSLSAYLSLDMCIRIIKNFF